MWCFFRLRNFCKSNALACTICPLPISKTLTLEKSLSNVLRLFITVKWTLIKLPGCSCEQRSSSFMSFKESRSSINLWNQNEEQMKETFVDIAGKVRHKAITSPGWQTFIKNYIWTHPKNLACNSLQNMALHWNHPWTINNCSWTKLQVSE